jgi:N-acetylglucosamine-6-phosphate deacetylase
MSGLHHREPGMVGAALAHARRRAHPRPAARAPRRDPRALRCIPGLFCVTDSTAAAGMPDGDYRLGEHSVHKCMGGVRLPDGTLAGSADDGPGAAQSGGPGPAAAERRWRVSTAAADYLGLADRGRLVPAPGPIWWCWMRATLRRCLWKVKRSMSSLMLEEALSAPMPWPASWRPTR